MEGSPTAEGRNPVDDARPDGPGRAPPLSAHSVGRSSKPPGRLPAMTEGAEEQKAGMEELTRAADSTDSDSSGEAAGGHGARALDTPELSRSGGLSASMMGSRVVAGQRRTSLTFREAMHEESEASAAQFGQRNALARETIVPQVPEGLPKSEVEYTFAVVLDNSPKKDPVEAEKQRDSQVEVVARLLHWGLTVRVLATTVETEHKLVLVLHARTNGRRLLLAEERGLETERFLKYGVVAMEDDIDDETMISRITPAREIFLTDRIVRSALEPFLPRVHGYDIDDPDAPNRPGAPPFRGVVLHAFPLHDEQFNDQFVREYARAILSPKRVMSMDKHIDQLRYMFGERVAFYFAYAYFYTLWIVPLAGFGVLYYVLFRFVHWPSYARGLSILGFCVPVIWGTLMLRYWERKTHQYLFNWKIDRVPEAEYQNPHNPAFQMQKVEREINVNRATRSTIAEETEKVYDPLRRRVRVAIFVFVFAVVNLAVLVLVATPFIQWYAYGKMSPVCDDCLASQELEAQLAAQGRQFNLTRDPNSCELTFEGTYAPQHCIYFVTCFNTMAATVGTDRWVYILIQGIVLGIVLDIAQFEFFVWATEVFTKAENHGTEAAFEKALIRKQFGFLFVNMFFWFLWLAFMYVPFGRRIFALLIDMGLDVAVPGYGWQDGILAIDEFWVTPLVVTQSLNLVLETFVPVLVTRATRKAARTRRNLREKAMLVRERSASLRDSVKRRMTVAQSSRRVVPYNGGGQATSASHPSSATLATRPQSESVATASELDLEDGGSQAGEGSAVTPLAKVGEDMLLIRHGTASLKRANTQGLLVAASVSGMDEFLVDFPAAMDFVERCREKLDDARSVRLILKTDDSNDYDATEVVQQASKDEYHPRKDHLDLSMQFGYVVQFSVAWPLAATCALVNNVLEVRGDAFKIMFGSRRPVPREDKGIGEWLPMLRLETYLAVPIVATMIVLSTGELEWWLPDCHQRQRECDHNLMNPDFTCVSWGSRIAVALVLEHLGFFMIWCIHRYIPGMPDNIKRMVKDRDNIIQRQIQDRFLPALPIEFQENLRVVYDRFEESGDELLDKAEATKMFLCLTDAANHKVKANVDKLFEFADLHGRGQLTFAECAYALARAEQHPTLRRTFGVEHLGTALKVAANHFRAERQQMKRVSSAIMSLSKRFGSTARLDVSAVNTESISGVVPMPEDADESDSSKRSGDGDRSVG